MIQLSTHKEFKNMTKFNEISRTSAVVYHNEKSTKVRRLLETYDVVTIDCDDINAQDKLTDTAKVYITNSSGVVTHEIVIKCGSFHDEGVIDSIEVVAHD